VAGQGFMNVQGLKKIIQFDLFRATISISPQIPFCYFVLYFLIPFFFLRKKYAAGSAVFIGSLVMYWIINYSVLHLSFQYSSAFFGLNPPPTYVVKVFALPFHYTGALASCCLMCSIKFLKFWYLKQQENVELKRENSVAELQLLKAQVHPHFLFNTLNNIYSFSLSNSPLAGDLIEKLSDILRYMTLEGQNTWVPLKKELKLIQDYISLEKVRYGERLDIKVIIKGESKNKFIAPLLMIPFVENSFKHGSSRLLDNPTIDLAITIEEDQLIFILSNNKPDVITQDNQFTCKGGIGLKNTTKRLQLLYPDRHTLKIESTATTFVVHMHVVLQKIKEENLETSPFHATDKNLSYAPS